MSNDAWASALEEAESPERRDRGLWARCFAEADGDESKAKAAYVRARIASATVASPPPPAPPLDGYCPNCATPCNLKAIRCSACGAEFDGAGWKPVTEKPAGVGPPKKRPETLRSPSSDLSAPTAKKESSTGWWKWLIGIPVGGFILLMVIGSCTDSPERQQRFRESDAIKFCWQEQGRKSLDPATARFAASACEQMEADFRRRWGRAP